MMMAPIFSKGAKIAERAPTTTLAWPDLTLRHSSNFSPSDKPECMIATKSPKREMKRLVIWGVREISGTKTIAVFPMAKVLSIRCK